MTLTENAAPTPLDVAMESGARRLAITDAGAYLNELPEQSSVSDLREIVHRAVLAADDTGLLATSRLLAEVGSDRYRVTSAEGMYL
ncbi:MULTISPECIES: hypothetical protein [unclassified Mycolicibacterium]|uniref:hypothetical protein n=1 Tax=unclassified Mycolicibacterium TaxID=2636767 RepID=UPI001BB2F2D3|nr:MULTISPECIES: hypothetical protein [unclassified Mycolicibacterium]